MKPNFKSGVQFGPNLMGCEMRKIKVVMNKQVYLGRAILDPSKIVMYKFHYDYMVPKYGKKLDLCYMDTDSVIYNIEQRISIRILQRMSWIDLIQVVITLIDHYPLV